MRLQVRQTLHSAAFETTGVPVAVYLPSRPWRTCRIPSWTAITKTAKTPSTSVTWRPWSEATKCSQCKMVVGAAQAQQLTWPTTSTGHPTNVKPMAREVLGPFRCITSQVCWQHSHHRASIGVSNPAISTQMFARSIPHVVAQECLILTTCIDS